MADSLAEYLGDEKKQEKSSLLTLSKSFDEVRTAKEFCQLVLESREFREYIVNSLTLGSLPPAVITRMMDYAWGKPVELHEHTGKDGAPIAVTKVVRVIIDKRQEVSTQDGDEACSPRVQVH